jgi:hypothetical protein
MYESEMRQLEQLAEQARRGDAVAAAELRRRLLPQMPCIVRRALRPQTKATASTRRIRDAAAAMNAHAPQSEPFVQRVGRRIVAMICGDFKGPAAAARPMQETVRF